MPDEFDPYSVWLGIRETARPLSHYQLLGLSEFEENPLAISLAADAAVARLNRLDPGDRRGRWQQTLDEVSLARLCLTNRTRKIQYDVNLRERRGPGAAPAIAAPAMVPVAAVPAAPAPLVQPVPAAYPQPAVMAQPVYVAVPAVQPMVVPMVEPMSWGTVADFVPSVAADVAVLPEPSAVSEVFAVESPISRSSTRSRQHRDAPDPKVWGAAAAVALTLLVSFVVFKLLDSPPHKFATSATAPAAAERHGSTTAVMVNPHGEPVDVVRPKIEETPIAPAVEPTKPPEAATPPKPRKQITVTEIAQNDEPAPEEPATEPEPPSQSPEQKSAFEKAARNARAAMGSRQFDVARQELQQAKASVGTAEQDAQLARLEELSGYVEGFWKAVLESMKGLQATDTLPIDNTEIAIVEVDGEKLTIRAAGRNLSYTLQNMPSGLALALAKRWFKAGEAANNLYLGAFHAVDPQGNLNEARRCWEAATRGGANAESLMPLLGERTQPLVTEQQPVPVKSLVARARAALIKSMPDEFRAAKSLERKLSLARQLLDAAAVNENPIERYTLYQEALNLAGDAGSVTDMLTAIDGLIAGYKLDPWQLRADAFADAADAANNPVIAKAMAGDMLEIVDQAIAENQSMAALKLCNALLSAAKKGKDLNLVRQATERKAKLAGAGQ